MSGCGDAVVYPYTVRVCMWVFWFVLQGVVDRTSSSTVRLRYRCGRSEARPDGCRSYLHGGFSAIDCVDIQLE